MRLERGLLPSPILERHAHLAWAAKYRPGSNRLRLGGDFSDLVEADGTVHLLVGDVQIDEFFVTVVVLPPE